MAVPTRRQKSMSNVKQTIWAEKNKREQKEDKPITDEEHQERLNKLKEMGLLKD